MKNLEVKVSKENMDEIAKQFANKLYSQMSLLIRYSLKESHIDMYNVTEEELEDVMNYIYTIGNIVINYENPEDEDLFMEKVNAFLDAGVGLLKGHINIFYSVKNFIKVDNGFKLEVQYLSGYCHNEDNANSQLKELE